MRLRLWAKKIFQSIGLYKGALDDRGVGLKSYEQRSPRRVDDVHSENGSQMSIKTSAAFVAVCTNSCKSEKNRKSPLKFTA